MGYEAIQNNCGIFQPQVTGFNCSAACTAGKQVLGGGCSLGAGDMRLVNDYPNGTTGWGCTAVILNPDSGPFIAYAFCANMQ